MRITVLEVCVERQLTG